MTAHDPAAEHIASRTVDLRGDLATIARAADTQGAVAWVESARAPSGTRTTIGVSTVDLSRVLASALFERVPTVVLTSATLATPGERGPSFEFARTRLGAGDQSETLVVPSPFEFARRAGLYVPRDLPDPSDPLWPDAAAAKVAALLDASGGGAFVLSTSSRLKDVFAERLRGAPYPILVQGEASKGELLARFRESMSSVLVATMSFWEGVDVPGHALRLVIMDKIPFPVPSDPLVMARAAALEREGRDPFYEYSVPQAAILLKQGFGRLIRTREDGGVVALLDRRALTRPYGRLLLGGLPPAERLRTVDDVRELFARMDIQGLPIRDNRPL